MLAYTHGTKHIMCSYTHRAQLMTLQDSVGSSSALLSSSGRRIEGYIMMTCTITLICGVELHPIGAGHEFVT